MAFGLIAATFRAPARASCRQGQVACHARNFSIEAYVRQHETPSVTSVMGDMASTVMFQAICVLSMKGSMQIAMTLSDQGEHFLIWPPLALWRGVKRPWRVLKSMGRVS